MAEASISEFFFLEFYDHAELFQRLLLELKPERNLLLSFSLSLASTLFSLFFFQTMLSIFIKAIDINCMRVRPFFLRCSSSGTRRDRSHSGPSHARTTAALQALFWCTTSRAARRFST
jgi:hypothetical protein